MFKFIFLRSFPFHAACPLALPKKQVLLEWCSYPSTTVGFLFLFYNRKRFIIIRNTLLFFLNIMGKCVK